MDRAATLARLKLDAAASSRPALSDDELGLILDRNRRPDPEGRVFGDDGYVPTWDPNAAAADAWNVKAGRVAGDFSFSADGASFSKGDVMANILEMRDRFAELAGHGTAMRGRGGDATVPYYDRDDRWDGTLIP